MTRKQLEARTKDELVAMARKRRVRGWHDMTKAALIDSLIGGTPVGVRHDNGHVPNGRRVANPGRAADGAAKSQPDARPAITVRPADKSDVATLRALNKKELVRTAREKHVLGWHSMSKEQLIQALSRMGRNGARASAAPATNRRTDLPVKVTVMTIPGKDLSVGSKRTSPNREPKDRIVALARDAYWIHAIWEINPGAMGRAEAALGQEWFGAKAVLRLLEVSNEDATHASESVLRDIPIHGGVNNWYIDVKEPQHSYRVDIGYLTERGRFYSLARSNIIVTPKPGVSDQIEAAWDTVDEEFDKIMATANTQDPALANIELRGLFEDRIKRPMSTGTLGAYGAGALAGSRRRGFHFDLDAELIVYGSTDRHARVTIQGEPVPLRNDGTFTLRFSLPDGRQILPAVAATHDGIEERTIILAVERNTKELEPMVHDGQEY